MSVVKINALAIPPQAGDEIVKRFTARLDELSTVDGFEGFELLRPTADTETRWFVYTRWADEAAFQAWRSSDMFGRSHAQQHAQTEASDGDQGGSGPVATGSSLLEFDIAVAAGPAS